MDTLRIDGPDLAFGSTLLEKFGGAKGELAVGMRRSIQGLNADEGEELTPKRRRR